MLHTLNWFGKYHFYYKNALNALKNSIFNLRKQAWVLGMVRVPLGQKVRLGYKLGPFEGYQWVHLSLNKIVKTRFT